MRSLRPSVLVQATRHTARPADRLINDLASLDVPDCDTVEQGRTYIVFAPRRRRLYGSGRAVALAILVCLGVLIGSAWSVVVIAFLPIAVLPLLPLLLDDRPMLAIGAVLDDDGSTLLTAHGRAWGELAAAVEAYLANLPPAPLDLEGPAVPAPALTIAGGADPPVATRA